MSLNTLKEPTCHWKTALNNSGKRWFQAIDFVLQEGKMWREPAKNRTRLNGEHYRVLFCLAVKKYDTPIQAKQLPSSHLSVGLRMTDGSHRADWDWWQNPPEIFWSHTVNDILSHKRYMLIGGFRRCLSTCLSPEGVWVILDKNQKKIEEQR